MKKGDCIGPFMVGLLVGWTACGIVVLTILKCKI